MKNISTAASLLRFSSIFYAVGAVVLLYLGKDIGLPIRYDLAAAACLIQVGITEWTRHHLMLGKYWAWMTSVCTFALYIPSLFLPLGIWGMMCLLDKEVRGQFQKADLVK